MEIGIGIQIKKSKAQNGFQHHMNAPSDRQLLNHSSLQGHISKDFRKM